MKAIENPDFKRSLEVDVNVTFRTSQETAFELLSAIKQWLVTYDIRPELVKIEKSVKRGDRHGSSSDGSPY